MIYTVKTQCYDEQIRNLVSHVSVLHCSLQLMNMQYRCIQGNRKLFTIVNTMTQVGKAAFRMIVKTPCYFITLLTFEQNEDEYI